MVLTCRNMPFRRAGRGAEQAMLPPRLGDPDIGKEVGVRTLTDGGRTGKFDVATNESWKDR